MSHPSWKRTRKNNATPLLRRALVSRGVASAHERPSGGVPVSRRVASAHERPSEGAPVSRGVASAHERPSEGALVSRGAASAHEGASGMTHGSELELQT